MKKRTKLCDRILPAYSVGEERMNMITHVVGAGLSVAALLMCVIRAAWRQNGWGVTASVIYGISLISLYTVSGVYHGMKCGTAKKVMQVIDHCTNSLSQQQFRIGRAVTAAALFTQQFQNIGIGGGLHGEVFPETGVPCESGFQRPGIAADTGLVIDVERGGDFVDDFSGLLKGQEGSLFHGGSLISFRVSKL